MEEEGKLYPAAAAGKLPPRAATFIRDPSSSVCQAENDAAAEISEFFKELAAAAPSESVNFLKPQRSRLFCTQHYS